MCRIRRATGRLGARAMLLGCIWIAGLAAAQERNQIFVRAETAPVGAGPGFAPAMTRSQFQRYASILALTDAQQILANEMLREYERSFQSRADEIRAQMAKVREEVQSTGDFRDYGREMASITRSWAREREKLEAALVDNIKSLLNEDQVELWPRFEREKRRADLLPDWRLAGENIDLITMIESLELDERVRRALDDLLEQYAVQLDHAIVSRERRLESLREEWREAVTTDREKAEEIWEDATDCRAAVRDVNRRTLRLLVAELAAHGGDELAARLERAYEERAYPEAFAQTEAERLFEWLDDEEGLLSADQAEAVEAIRSTFRRELDALRRRLIEEILHREGDPPPFFHQFETEGGAVIAFTIATAGPSSDDSEEKDEFTKLLESRSELSSRTVSKLETVLTREQREQLPSVEGEPIRTLPLRTLRFNL